MVQGEKKITQRKFKKAVGQWIVLSATSVRAVSERLVTDTFCKVQTSVINIRDAPESFCIWQP